MKLIPFFLLVFSSIALAQNQPVPPPAAPPPPPEADESTEKRIVTFLGVSTDEVPDVLSAQLNLTAGFGLVVDEIVPDSPAAKAGLLENDVLTRLNDQLLVTPDQLAALVRSFKNGDTITLTYLRRGQQQSVTATLAQREIPKRRGHGMGPGRFKPRDMLGPKQGGRQSIFLHEDNGIKRIAGIDLDDADFVMRDKEGSIEITNEGDKRTVIVRAPDDKILFDGPVEAIKRPNDLPKPVQDRLEKLDVVPPFEIPLPPPSTGEEI
jgi:membrane-associated protease RseP (regulator of RpoE activity)